ncbi:pyridoxal-phosphate dependent enzyme [Paucibacter sp. O1-1]|uniref:pyridoxal-phosphate dependent enzyme n=1 Tax=Paucibacter sp. M5-1 TaxID=3015998 RepID=UPI0021D4B9F7|nr:pyridoxal-phosphate dependent enzyme [Paucibacter sp. M5-1]MCU7372088.1 pyridoxal-phosphate dependent enzyme [Paucibacter sp. O1-1]MCZ7880710.1 pyridoxal-phosphate dependent enzyme [Paucibacter sp. M5-1]MDA3827078.1 pyridoxal-phosphate dependent enzyme [Paucibacter sp. O1-1]
MKPLHLNTPLLRAAPGQFSHPEVWLKMDALQPSGSFKLRGVGRLVRKAAQDGAKEIVCASGGNAGFAAAYAGQALGLTVTIVLPETSSAAVQSLIEARGATVLRHGAVWDASNEFAQALAAERGATYVHPFDHPLLWEGHASLIDEVLDQGLDFDAVVTAVGGGGLFAGIVQGLRRHGLNDIPVIAVETEGAASLHESLKAGQAVTLPAITSIATSLGARRVADEALRLAQLHPTHSLLVSDAQACGAAARLAEQMRVMVEPACGAALAAVDVHPELFARFKRPLVEVCGGVAVSLEKLQAWTISA